MLDIGDLDLEAIKTSIFSQAFKIYRLCSYLQITTLSARCWLHLHHDVGPTPFKHAEDAAARQFQQKTQTLHYGSVVCKIQIQIQISILCRYQACKAAASP